MRLAPETGFGGMGLRKSEQISQEDEMEGRHEKSDYFVLDMESLSNCTDIDNTLNTRISRNLSRKGSQRGEMKSVAEREASGSDGGGVASGSPKGSCTPETSVTLHMHIMEAADPIANAQVQHVKQTNAENKHRRYYKQRSTWIDPWRILGIFATLSSIGSIILIYSTLSLTK